MATTRKKPATSTKTSTKAAAATKFAKKAGTYSSAAIDAEIVAAAAVAVAEPPAAKPLVRTAAASKAAPEPKSAAPKAAPVPAAEKAPAAKPAETAGVERRRSPREKIVAPAVLQPSSGDASVDRGVQVQDLSLGGVGFVAAEQFGPGEVYRITLGKGPLLLNARVKIISCNKTGHRMYRCGAEFC